MSVSGAADRGIVATLRDVVKRYGSTLALDHVDFEIGKGEILGLLGPNGAGKTTAIRALVRPDRRSTPAPSRCSARPSARASWTLKRRIGLVTQEITIFEDLSARENLQFFGGLYGLRGQELKDRIAETLEFVGLTENADKRAKKYSGGMKRRLNVACALTHRPELLIMDEPTVGIDPQSRNHILEQVRALCGNGHDHPLHLPLHGGGRRPSPRACSSWTRATSSPAAPWTSWWRASSTRSSVTLEVGEPTPAVVEAIGRIAGVKQVTREGTVLHVVSEAGSKNLDRIISCAQAAGGVRSIRADKPTLEDVFLTLTGKKLRDGGEA